MTVSHTRWVTSPEVIRQVLALSDSHKRTVVMARFGVSHHAIWVWREKRAQAAAEGRVWPSDEDVANYRALAAKRACTQRWRKRYQMAGHLLVDVTGTRRRLRALSTLGWRYDDIAARLGVHRNRIAYLTSEGDRTVHRDAAAAVVKVYDDLGGALGPSRLAAGRAKARGWAPPLAWSDETIDDPKARPCGVRPDESPVRGYRDPDREEKVLALTRAGLSAADIALRLRTNKRYVQRVRSRYRVEGAA